MADVADDRPALLGGRPLRPQGPPDWPVDDGEVAAVLQELAASRAWGRYQGPYCDRLIEALRRLAGCEHVLLCASGTAAVELALRGLQVAAGHEVLLAAYDFKANFTNVLDLGATPVLVDVRREDCQLDVAILDRARTSQTRAVIASHLHGGVVDMPHLREWADRHGLFVLEDACQAQGATLYGRPAGTWGDVGVFSFGGSKLLSSGRGGAVFTHSAAIAQRIRLYTQRGNEAYPLSELQAAVLLPQFDRLIERHRRREEAAATLRERMRYCPGLVPFPPPRHDCDPAYYKFAFHYDPREFSGLAREQFVEALRAEGIAIDAGFRALHLIHARGRFRTVEPLLHAEQTDAQLVKLHHPVLLGRREDLEQIVTAVERVRRFSADLAALSPTGNERPRLDDWLASHRKDS